MNLDLWEGETDSLAIEFFVDLLVHVEEYSPVVSTFDPSADSEVHTAGSQFSQCNEGSGIFQNTIVSIDEFHECCSNFLHICAVFNSYCPIYASQFFGAVVGNASTTESTIGNVDLLVVDSQDDRVENLDFLYDSIYTLRFNVVTYFVGLEKQQDDSACQILQISAQSHSYSYTS